MILEILRQQKEELQRLLSLTYNKRAKFDFAYNLMDIQTIKAIIGPRRAGKSTFALSLIQASKKEYIYT